MTPATEADQPKRTERQRAQTAPAAKKPAGKPLVRPRLPAERGAADTDRDDLIDEAVLSSLEVGDIDWRERSARLIDVEGCRLTGTALTGSRLERLTVCDSQLRRCDLANVELSQGAMTRVEITSSRLTGMAAPGAVWRHVRVADCLADLSAFRFVSFTRVEFVDCRMQGADFVGADLTGTIFQRCDLSRAEFSQVKAPRVAFIDCTWDGIRGVTSLTGCTIVNRSPVDALHFTAAMASALGITLGDPDDFLDG